MKIPDLKFKLELTIFGVLIVSMLFALQDHYSNNGSPFWRCNCISDAKTPWELFWSSEPTAVKGIWWHGLGWTGWRFFNIPLAIYIVVRSMITIWKLLTHEHIKNAAKTSIKKYANNNIKRVMLIAILVGIFAGVTFLMNREPSFDHDVELTYTELQQEEIEVINTLIEDIIKPEIQKGKIIIIEEQSESGSMHSSFNEYKEELIAFCNTPEDYELALDYLSKNMKSSNWTQAQVKHTILPKAITDKLFGSEIEQESKETGWQGFYKQFPEVSGILTISRVGFNKSKTRALISYNLQSGWLAGGGSYEIYEKKGGKWVQSYGFIRMGWVS